MTITEEMRRRVNKLATFAEPNVASRLKDCVEVRAYKNEMHDNYRRNILDNKS